MGAVWVCQSAPSPLCFGVNWGLLRRQHVPRERDPSGCASRALPSLLLWDLGVIERATCASGTGAVWVCPSAPSPLCFGGNWGLLRRQHVPRERDLSGCASRALPSLLLRDLGVIERATCASGTGAVWVCQMALSPLCLCGIRGDICI